MGRGFEPWLAMLYNAHVRCVHPQRHVILPSIIPYVMWLSLTLHHVMSCDYPYPTSCDVM